MWVLAPLFVVLGGFGLFLAGKFSDSERRSAGETDLITDSKFAVSLGVGIILSIMGVVMLLTLLRDAVS